MRTYNVNLNSQCNELNFKIPFTIKGSDIDIDKVRAEHREFAQKLIAAFTKRIIHALEKRISKCLEDFLPNVKNIEYSDESGHIIYKRGDNTIGKFNILSAKCMEETIQILKEKAVPLADFSGLAIDQILKALLMEEDHSNLYHLGEEYKYSDLISLLCELHIMKK